MTVNIEKMRLEMKAEGRKFLLQMLVTIATCLAGGAALATLVFHLTGALK
jgi:hypothetical protein